jgi:sporulation protein YlmC with PRC-barrel domain
MRISDLLGSEVSTESGKALGRVYDVRVEEGGKTLKIAGLLAGTTGLRARLVGNEPASEADPGSGLIPWSAVKRVADGLVVVTDDQGKGAKPS